MDLAECLHALCSSSSARKVEKLTYDLYRKLFDLRKSAEHVSSVTNCHKIANSAWKRCLVKVRFEWDLTNEKRVMLYNKSPIENLCRQRGCVVSPEVLQNRTQVYTIRWNPGRSWIYTTKEK